MLISPRWKKIAREIWGNKKRSFLVTLSIALGVMAVGFSTGARSILGRELPAGYLASQPAAASFLTSPFDEDLLESIRRTPGVTQAEGRRTLWTRIRTSPDSSSAASAKTETWRNLILFASQDFSHQTVNRIEPVQGAWPPDNHEVLLEQAALQLSNARIGENLLIQTPDGQRYSLRLTGLVHDQSQQPSTFEGNLYGYISLDTLEWLGEPRDYDELYITVNNANRDWDSAREVAERVREKIEDSGRTVFTSTVPEPGKHPLQDTVDGVLLLLGVFGLLCLVLSGFLVLNTISALLSQQIRQVGIMKAVGARTDQLAAMYLGMALLFGIAGALIGAPLGLAGARLLAQFIAGIVNADVYNLQVSPNVLVGEVIVGVLSALIAAIYPVVTSANLTIRQALSNNLLDQGQLQLRRLGKAASRLNLLPLTLSLALRNSLRARGRLVLTLTTLTLASAFFIAVLSIYTSTRTSVEEIFRYWQYDLMINFDRPYRIEQLTHAAFQVPGVADIDPGVLVQTNRVYSDGRQGNAIFLYAMPANTFSLRPRLLEGRWLLPQDENAMVVSNRFLEEEPDVQVGDLVRLKLSGRESDWRVVGIIHMMYADGPTVYVNIPYYAQEVSSTGCASQLYVLTHLHGPAEQDQVMHELDRVFKQNGIHITFSIPMATLRASISEIFNAVVIVLMVMAILLSIVGGVGLMGIMELNVLERSREIGVLRAIGATDRRLLIIVLTEGISIGAASWLMGSILAFPLSKWLSDAVGRAVIQTPFSYSYSYWGAGLWLVLILLLSGLSCASPALRASRVTIREALAYE